MVIDATDTTEELAKEKLLETNWHTKLAIVSLLTGLSVSEAKELLLLHHDNIRLSLLGHFKK